MTARAETVTILFTDLVGSTELLQRAGDEQAQRIFKAHHRLLSEAVGQYGGHEVKWLGDGLMVAFDSAQEAVKCAIAMQQSSRRPAAGERLEIRAGLNVGEALLEESDYFGTPVVVARRLCDRADSGQIFASDLVVRLLDGRREEIEAKELGPLELKGIADAIPAVEIVYEHDPMALLRKLPFVGRQSEYEALLKKLTEAQNGRGSVVLLAGEPGIGKTRLVEEFCDHASSSSTVIRGNSYEGDVAAPFEPWLEALRSLTERLSDDALREAVGPGGPDIAVILPELRRHLPDLEEPPKLDPESERGRLFEGIATFLRNAAEQRPLVIFLDDLQWSDRPSLALLEQVARGVGDRRIMVVGTYRDMEVDRVHPLAQTLAALRRLEYHERLALRGMPREEVDDLLTAIEPSEESRPVRRVLSAVLFRETEGNPLFIWEVITHLVETGKIVHEGGRWTSHIENVADLGIPEGVREAIGRRLSGLSESCNGMLQRTSAMTGGFSWEELRAICDESEDELLDALDEALGAQLLAEGRRGEYAFTHSLIRATLYEELSTPRRVRLHRRVAEALEEIYADDLDAHLGELAAHYMASAGADAEKAIEYSIRAGNRAKELFAWEEAAVHYRRALDAMPEGAGEERRGAVLLELGQALQYESQYADAVEAYRRAAISARAISSAEMLGHAASGFDDAAWFIPGDSTVPAQRRELIDEALQFLGSEDSSLRARLLARRARAALGGGGDAISSAGGGSLLGHRNPDVVRQAREAVEVAERVGDAAVTALTFNFLWQTLGGPGNLRAKREIAGKTIQIAHQADAVRDEYDGWQWLFATALAQGDMEAVHEADEQAFRLAEQSRIGWTLWGNMARRAAIELAGGRLVDAEGAILNAWSSGQSMNAPSAASAFVAQLIFLRWYQGRLNEAEAMMRDVVEQSPNLAIVQVGLALVLAETGQGEGGRGLLNTTFGAGFEAIPEDAAWMVTMAVLAEVYHRLGYLKGAKELYETVSRHPDENVTLGANLSGGAIARSLGQLATLLERWDDAERHFEAALSMNEKMGHRPALAQTRLNYGDMLLRRASTGSAEADDRERAITLLQTALGAAREMGMAKVVEDCERLLAKAGKA